MHTLRRLLWPFSLIYGLVVGIRNFLFDKGILKSYSFPLPIISVGNMSTGGTGKTPHVEYLIRLLKDEYRIATLSRGYGRKTSGFILVSDPSGTHMIGDEPMQYHSKFGNIMVSVGEDRVDAVKRLMMMSKPPEVILMDDAYQHRKIKPGLQILLMEYDSMFRNEPLLPAGNMREWKSGMKRADIIVISKSPNILVPIEKKRILEQVKHTPDQKVFFSFIRYGEFVRLNAEKQGMFMSADYYLEKRYTILLVTGIANPAGMIAHLRRLSDKIEILTFPDHHEFNERDIQIIKEKFGQIANPSKIIVTTEKDAMRLRNPEVEIQIKNLPFFYLPIETVIHHEQEVFDKLIMNYVRENQKHS
ncbi:MAG: tetraacyldisaccharide 4'-kinase [Bacteroidetes bacterium]|nr:MAG: tetraacyldisaccharide 4'-kinase [Bacteroidota bacterium]